METDARGQLGGVETTDGVRQRLAGESGAFKCSTCGRSNADIIKESERLCAEQGVSSASDAVEVPSELKLGYRDEMEAGKAEAAKAQPPASTDAVPAVIEDAEAAELAEGFVQTAPQAAPLAVAAAPASTNARPVPAQGVPQPTATGQPATLVPNARPVQPPALAQARRHTDDGVPIWIDRAIVVLVVLLAALLLKIMFDF